MKIQDTVAVITGAAGAVGREVAIELAQRGVHGLALVDPSRVVKEVASTVNRLAGDLVCYGYRGGLGDPHFRRRVYEETAERCGVANVCVPAFGGVAARVGNSPPEDDVLACIAWAKEMVSGIARRSRSGGDLFRGPPAAVKGMVFFIRLFPPIGHNGSPSHAGIVDKLKHVATSFVLEADHAGVRCAVMLPQEPHLMPRLRSRHEIEPNAVAKAISFLIAQSSEGAARPS